MYGLNSRNSAFIIGLILAIGFICIHNTNGARILGVFTSHSKSHMMVHMAIVKELALAGHDVTVVSSEKPLSTHPKIRHVIIAPTKESEDFIETGLKEMASKRKNMFSMVEGLFTMRTLISMQFDALKDERFTQLYNEKFDLVMVGYFFNDFQFGVAAKFNCPLIVNWLSSPIGYINEIVGNPLEIAYVPDINLAVKTGESMDFAKRFQNFITTGFMSLFQKGMTIWLKSMYRQLYPSENFPTYEDMKKNVSLIFCNSHFSEGPIRPNVPAIVEIGGIQIKQKPEPLPKDIGDFLDLAKTNGAILFCLGSNLRASSIKSDIVQIIFNTLSSLKQKVIWKWDDLDNVPGKSPNILYKKWIPQDDILAHPNIKLFITHAGKGGIAEAQYHGVPMLALPVFAEQPTNAEKMAMVGYGIKLDLLSLNKPEFKNAILEVLQNPKYKENIKRFSELYRDRPMTAKENIVYWTEYVLRHHGAPHLQSPLVHLNFIQSTSLDVIGVLFIILYIIFKITKLIFKLIFKKRNTNKEKKNKKKKN